MSAAMQGQERVITLADAIREGIDESFARDESTFLFAQGVADPSSMWGTLKGIGNKFGADRVIEMPIADPMLRTRLKTDAASVLSRGASVAKASMFSGMKTKPKPSPWMMPSRESEKCRSSLIAWIDTAMPCRSARLSAFMSTSSVSIHAM